MAEQVVLAVINRAENLSCLYDMVQAAELKAAGYFPGCSLRLFFLCAEKATQCLQDVLRPESCPDRSGLPLRPPPV